MAEGEKAKKQEDVGTDKFVYNYMTNISGVEEENRILKETVFNLERELDKFKNTPLLVCEIKSILPENQSIIRLPNGNEFLVNTSANIGKLGIGDGVAVEQKNLTIVRKLDTQKSFDVERFVIVEKPNTPWEHIGGLQKETEEIKEVIELPLKKPKLFEKVGIQPPKGILLHGEPGTGKTLLAKAVAASTNSTFIEVVGSELVQKFIGEGAKLVKEIFQLAREHAPSIVFIDELDAIAATRMDIGTSGEREVQRTFMQLLSEIDGFKHLDNVKIIGCTNRKDILDPAIIRPGRLDRLIEVPLPDEDGIKEIFKIHTRNMKLNKVNTEDIISAMRGFSGADIKSVCTEAGYFAIRNDRTTINHEDFLDAVNKVAESREFEDEEYMNMFG